MGLNWEDGISHHLIIILNQIRKGWYFIIIKMLAVLDIIIVDIGLRLPFIAKLVHMTESDVMIVAYRGYSDS